MLFSVLSFPLIFLIKIYHLFLSPLLPKSCRYEPTCSSYTIEAIKVWGPFKGVFLGAKRIISCRPGGGCGHDPVPKKD
ncbi:MAG: membrane protein insertion efficiency factor YidD [Crocinitomicaceae bacterium]|nr:membrane protein insertion efficiency factor YidD [Crocinitomicaceae bacterium]